MVGCSGSRRKLQRASVVVLVGLASACSLVIDASGLSDGVVTVDRSDATSGDALPADALAPSDASTSAYENAVLADLPLAYYRFADTTVARDSSGNAHDGVYVGGVDLGVSGALASEATSRAIHLNGKSAWVNVGDLFHFAARTPMTIEAWVKPDALTTYHGIVTNESADGRGGYRMLMSPADGFAMERIFVLPDARATSSDTSLLPPVALARWSHLVATYDGSEQALFVNGQEVKRRTETTDLSAAPGALFAIGARASGTAPSFKGSLAEVAVYDHPLPAARIAIHRALGL